MKLRTQWQCALELNANRDIISGSEAALCDAIRRGADLRIYTEFIFNEHIDVESDNNELVQEVSEFGVTYLLEDRWTAGIMSLRQPITLPDRFGPSNSMSFFLYNQNGQQAIARPHFDKQVANTASIADMPSLASEQMPKYHLQEAFDVNSKSPSHNFMYDFDSYRFCVQDNWQEVLSHDKNGAIISGSLNELTDAFAQGCEIKIGIKNLSNSLQEEMIDHEIFVQAGPAYYGTKNQWFVTGTHPLIRVQPSIPLLYKSNNWDFGWVVARSDGHVVYRRCDPQTLTFEDHVSQHALRWFVR